MKRISTGLVGAVLMFGMLPGVASAGGLEVGTSIIDITDPKRPVYNSGLCVKAGLGGDIVIWDGVLIRSSAPSVRVGPMWEHLDFQLNPPAFTNCRGEPRAGGAGDDVIFGGVGHGDSAADIAKLRSFGQWGLAPDQAQQGHATPRRPGFTFYYGGYYAFGLACAADRPSTYDPATDTYVPRIGVRAGPCEIGDITLQRGVTDSSGAAEVLAQAMDNTPDQAQPGLEQAWEAVTTAAAHEHAADPATGEAPAAAPAQVTAPPVTAPPVTAPPATTPPVTTPPVDPGLPATPPVDAPAGPPSDVPGGRP
jgi:hypothetical protein